MQEMGGKMMKKEYETKWGMYFVVTMVFISLVALLKMIGAYDH